MLRKRAQRPSPDAMLADHEARLLAIEREPWGLKRAYLSGGGGSSAWFSDYTIGAGNNWAGTNLRHRRMKLPSSDIGYNTLGLTVSGDQSSVIVPAPGLYEVVIYVSIGFPYPQPAAERLVGIDLLGWTGDTGVIFPGTPGLDKVGVGAAGSGSVTVFSQARFVDEVTTPHVPWSFGIEQLEDEQSSSYRSTAIGYSLCILRLDAARA